jgi:hypothetical protein
MSPRLDALDGSHGAAVIIALALLASGAGEGTQERHGIFRFLQLELFGHVGRLYSGGKVRQAVCGFP